MQKQYEAPQLAIVGKANDVVMGSSCCGTDGGVHQGAPDFEFEFDWPLI